MKSFRSSITLLVASAGLATGAEPAPLPNTSSLTATEDRSAEMVAGIDRFLTRETDRSIAERAKHWRRDLSSGAAYERSVLTNREHLVQAIGAVDERVKFTALDYASSTQSPALAAETERIRIWAVRWPVFAGVFGDGLLLEPKGKILARVVVLPDADQTPEMLAGLEKGVAPESQAARRLAENGCQVLVPTLIDRRDSGSGNSLLHRFTNQPHREWIYRQAFELGRHIIGYEVQKVRSALDWFTRQNALGSDLKLGVVGYAEGGLIALYVGALDTRVASVLVSGYFDARERVWQEPIYRNVFGLLEEFGDAEIASLIAPRRLVIEHSDVPPIDGPPKPRAGRSGAAPGLWKTPDFSSVEKEVRRATSLLHTDWATNWALLINGSEGTTVPLTSSRALTELLKGLGVGAKSLSDPGPLPIDQRPNFDPDRRQADQVEELVQHTQRLLRLAESVRDASFFRSIKPSSPENWDEAAKAWREKLWSDVIGRLPAANQPPNVRSRRVYDEPKWTGYDVVIDVWPEVFAWGVLLLPKDLQPGERRPVVVCQHGLEGLPSDTITQDSKFPAFKYYKGFASRLAERGFVVFSPHNPYRGEDKFRVLQRKANPLKASLFSVILVQHQRILDWLNSQPFVDPTRIGFYGLSYGGKTAMRVPALLDRYCLSICSADFNEWITKNATVDSGYSYLFGGEYEMPEFNLGHTFNYAEMAALIAPRPFMVERGHDDGVAPDEWVAHEYARVRRFYTKLGLADRTEIEFFDGPHTIHGEETFRFLHRHLRWPMPTVVQ